MSRRVRNPLRGAPGIAMVVLLASCTPQPPESAPTGSAASAPAVPTPTLVIDTLATGLVVPWGLALAPDGRLFVAERPGRLRVIRADGLRPEPLAQFDVHAEDSTWHPESGLMGIALAPDFAESGHAFLLATVPRRDVPAPPGFIARLARRLGVARPTTDELPFENRVLRVTIGPDSAFDVRVIVDGLYTNHYHAGGAIAFGPDGKLYVTVGDGRLPALAQRPDLPVGKLLRFESDGRIPADNPVPDSPVFAAGLRNTQAIAWLPDGTLLGVDHGPSGLPGERGRSGRDELNVLVAGGNYGWPDAAGWELVEGFQRPIYVWRDAVAPAGLAIARGGSGAWARSLFVGQLRGGIERLELAQDGPHLNVAVAERLPLPRLGRVRTILAAPDGSLYITTSNRDIRGVAGTSDDVVLRIHAPRPTTTP